MLDITVAIALIVALTQIIKPFVKANLIPVLSLVLGVVAGFFLFQDLEIVERVIYGIAIGLGASGTFDVSKVVTKKAKK
jgi:hypothetical protein